MNARPRIVMVRVRVNRLKALGMAVRVRRVRNAHRAVVQMASVAILRARGVAKRVRQRKSSKVPMVHAGRLR